MTGESDYGHIEVIGPMDVLAFWRAAGPDKWFTKDPARSISEEAPIRASDYAR